MTHFDGFVTRTVEAVNAKGVVTVLVTPIPLLQYIGQTVHGTAEVGLPFLWVTAFLVHLACSYMTNCVTDDPLIYYEINRMRRFNVHS